MNKKTLVIFSILVVVVIAGGIYALMRNSANDPMMTEEKAEDTAMMDKKDDAMIKDNSITKENGDSMMDKEDAMTRAGSYESYSPDKLALAEKGKVVLFFRASWCPTCRALDANIRSNLNVIPLGVTILDVNYDDSTALKQKYGVTYQHTLVQVNASGDQIAKWTGSPTIADLVSNIK